MTDRYAVVGNPIAHSKSPDIHAAFARETGQDLTYERLLAPLDGFVETVAQFQRAGGRGLNVTVPFKLEAFALAQEHSPRALRAGACNTLAWRGTHWFGDNTDGAGLVRDLDVNLGIALAGHDVLVLGAGGAARGILAPLLGVNPRSLTISNRTMDKADELARAFAGLGPVRALCAGGSRWRAFRRRAQRDELVARLGRRRPAAVARHGLRRRARSPTISCTAASRRRSSAGRTRTAPRASRTASACCSSRRRRASSSGAACGRIPRRSLRCCAGPQRSRVAR